MNRVIAVVALPSRLPGLLLVVVALIVAACRGGDSPGY
jgi:hypothetical protein